MAEALYRKYRPQVFEDVVGQTHVERTLKNAIDHDKVSHAYLFCGPRGTGKTTTARLLAKALLCEKGPTSSPDGTCRECVDIANGTHPDVYELDAASRTGVENVREEIIGRVNFAPTRGKKKIYIIDEVHMLSTAAFNALLKTLEEPPSHVVFILCTTDPQKVPATIHSRCQRFDFHRLSTDEIVSRLGAVCVAEGVEFEGDALDLVAHRAEGGMRNALTSLEQLIAFGEGKVTVQGAEDLLGSLDSTDMAEIVDAVGRRDVAACFNWTANYVESGADLAQFARDMAQHVRNLYVMSLAGADVALDVADAERRQLAGELHLFGPDRLARLLGVLGDLISDLRTATNPRLCFEIALTRMVRPDSDLTLESLAERIEALEAGKSAVAMTLPAVAPAQQAAPAPSAQAALVPGAPRAASAVAAPAAVQAAPTAAVAPAPQSARDAGQAVPMPPQRPFGQPAPQRPAAEPRRNPIAQQAAAAQPAPQQAAPVQPAPQQTAAAQPAPAQADSALAALVSNPAALQRTWRSVVSAIKKRNVSHGVLFVNVKARPEADASGVVVEFPADNPFAFAMASKPEVQAAIAEALDRAAGMHVPFRCVQLQAPIGQAAPSATVSRPMPPTSPAAQQTAPPAPVSQQNPIPAAPQPAAAPGPATAWAGNAAAPSPRPVASGAPPVDDVPLDVYESMAPADEAVDSCAQNGEEGVKAGDLSKMLSGSMGMNVTFEEVDE